MVMLVVMIMMVFMVVVVAVAFFIIMVVVLMAVAFFAVVVMVMLVVMIMFMVVVVSAAAFPIMMMVFMVVIVAVAFHVFIELVEEPAVIDGMVHPVLELMFVHIEDRAHECEIDLLLRFESSVFLHTVPKVREVKGHAGTVIERYGRLDVTQHRTGLLLDPFSYLDHRVG